MRRVIWSSPHAFRASSRVGAHHLAEALAADGWEVLFLSHPVTPAHWLATGAAARERRREARFGAPVAEGPGLKRLLPVTLAPLGGKGLQISAVLELWPALTVPGLKRRLARADFHRPDILVLDGPIGWPLRKLVRPRLSVLRLLDRLDGFRGTTPAVLSRLATAARQADLVTATTAGLVAHAADLGARDPVLLANGVRFDAFQAKPPLPPEYAAIPRPRVVYAGALGDWFDFGLLARVAEALATVRFVLIGPDEEARRRLPPQPNVVMLGSRPWEALPGYLAHADCGLIPFDVERYPALVNDINPLKLFEYLAAGLPVVSVRWRTLVELDPPAHLVSGATEMAAAVERAIQAPGDPGPLRAFARQYDWSRIAAAFRRLIEDSIPG